MRWTLLVVGALLMPLFACAEDPSVQLEANKELVRQFADVTNAADWDALAELVTEDLQRHSIATAGPPVRSRDEFIALQKTFVASMPDQQVTVHQMIAEGDMVALLATYSGTHTGPMGDFPITGKAAEVPFLALFRIEEGMVAELWVEWDNVAMLSQLGLCPPPPPPAG